MVVYRSVRRALYVANQIARSLDVHSPSGLRLSLTETCVGAIGALPWFVYHGEIMHDIFFQFFRNETE